MEKIISVPLGAQNQERLVSQALKGVRRRFEYAYKHDGNLLIVFSAKEMPIKTICKQMGSLSDRTKVLEQRYHPGTYSSVWREAGWVRLDGGKFLVFYDKTMDN